MRKIHFSGDFVSTIILKLRLKLRLIYASFWIMVGTILNRWFRVIFSKIS